MLNRLRDPKRMLMEPAEPDIALVLTTQAPTTPNKTFSFPREVGLTSRTVPPLIIAPVSRLFTRRYIRRRRPSDPDIAPPGVKLSRHSTVSIVMSIFTSPKHDLSQANRPSSSPSSLALLLFFFFLFMTSHSVARVKPAQIAPDATS
jgi:hypothetical protein